MQPSSAAARRGVWGAEPPQPQYDKIKEKYAASVRAAKQLAASGQKTPAYVCAYVRVCAHAHETKRSLTF